MKNLSKISFSLGLDGGVMGVEIAYQTRYNTLVFRSDIFIEGAMISSRNIPDIESVYEAYADEYYHYLCKLTRNQSAAEDLLHDAFVKISMRISSIRNQDRIRSWGFRIVLNVFRDWYRRQKRERTDVCSEIESVPDDRFQADLSRQSGDEWADRILSILSVEERIVFISNQIRRLSYSEISSLTGWSKRTIRRRMETAVPKVTALLRRLRIVTGSYCDFEGVKL